MAFCLRQTERPERGKAKPHQKAFQELRSAFVWDFLHRFGFQAVSLIYSENFLQNLPPQPVSSTWSEKQCSLCRWNESLRSLQTLMDATLNFSHMCNIVAGELDTILQRVTKAASGNECTCTNRKIDSCNLNSFNWQLGCGAVVGRSSHNSIKSPPVNASQSISASYDSINTTKLRLVPPTEALPLLVPIAIAQRFLKFANWEVINELAWRRNASCARGERDKLLNQS